MEVEAQSENSLEMNSFAITVAKQVSERTSDRVIREWFVRFSQNFEKSIDKPRLMLWLEDLGDLDPAVLDRTFRLTLRTCKFFPTIAEIRAHIEKADATALQLQAEEAWQRVQRFLDQGVWSGIRELTPQEKHAARVAGGLALIERSANREDLEWRRKRFVEAFARLHDLEANQELLGDGEAKRIIRQFTAQSKQPSPKELAPTAAPPAAESVTPDDPDSRRVRRPARATQPAAGGPCIERGGICS